MWKNHAILVFLPYRRQVVLEALESLLTPPQTPHSQKPKLDTFLRNFLEGLTRDMDSVVSISQNSLWDWMVSGLKQWVFCHGEAK